MKREKLSENVQEIEFHMLTARRHCYNAYRLLGEVKREVDKNVDNSSG